jgi:hypothetical protein
MVGTGWNIDLSGKVNFVARRDMNSVLYNEFSTDLRT